MGSKAGAEKGRKGAEQDQSVPNMRESDKSDRIDDIVALLISDMHLSLKAPSIRAEEDWWEVQNRYIIQLLDLANQYSCAKIICAGDVFDRAASPPELVNLALRWLPSMYAIPGNHDLPTHNYEERKKSSYWTLVEANRIINLPPGKPTEVTTGNGCILLLHGFPCSYPIKPLKKPFDMYLEVAVVHQYIWTYGTNYAGASPNNRLSKLHRNFQGYDVVLVGDNHHPFSCKFKKGPLVWNNGTFIRRKADEIKLQPSIGLLHRSGKITRHFLNVSKDKFNEPEKAKNLDDSNLSSFLEELKDLGDKTIDFIDAVDRFIKDNEVKKPVKEIILNALGMNMA